jgi:hypothetical protein
MQDAGRWRAPPYSLLSPCRPQLNLVGRGSARAVGEDVRELLDVIAGDGDVAVLVLLAQAGHQLGAQDVYLPVQDAPFVGDLHLLLGELANHILELYVGHRAKVRERVHRE